MAQQQARKPAPRKRKAATDVLPSVDAVGMTRRQMAEHLCVLATAGVEDAEPGSVAYVQSMRELRNAHAALCDIADKEHQPKRDASTMTAEEWLAEVRRDAEAATDAELEVYMAVWLDRNGVVLVTEGDDARLVRRTG